MLALSAARDRLLHDGSTFDPWWLSWQPGPKSLRDCHEASLLEAIQWLFSQPKVRRVPIGVIGPRCAADRQKEAAELLGRRLAALGVPMMGGGRSGVMEAACCGNRAGGGGVGTLSEIAFGLRFGRAVIALVEAPDVAGAARRGTVEEALVKVARLVLALDAR